MKNKLFQISEDSIYADSFAYNVYSICNNLFIEGSNYDIQYGFGFSLNGIEHGLLKPAKIKGNVKIDRSNYDAKLTTTNKIREIS